MATRVSRRRFVQHGLLAAGASAAVPYLVAGSALGKDGATPPSDRINMGFIGLGGQGSGHLFGGAWTYLPGGYLGRDDVQVLAVCDVQRKKAQAGKQRVEQHYAEKFGQGSYRGCGVYSDIRDLLNRDEIDAVLIAAAYHAAATNAILAARAGKDVYCEKPTSVTIRAGRAVVEAVRAHGRVYQGGTQQRSEYGGSSARRSSWSAVDASAVSNGSMPTKPAAASTPPPSTAHGPVPPDINWEPYVGPLPWFNYDGSTSAHRFGFGDINWGQHHYDIVQWGLGADDTGPVEIRLESGKPVYRYANGVEVFGTPPPGQAWNEGGACFVGTEGSITVHRNVFTSDPPELIRESSVLSVPGVYYSTSHSGNFLECVRTRQRTITDAETAHRAASLLLLGGITMRIGRTLKWDPQKEEFPDAPDANRLLSLAAREPWRY